MQRHNTRPLNLEAWGAYVRRAHTHDAFDVEVYGVRLAALLNDYGRDAPDLPALHASVRMAMANGIHVRQWAVDVLSGEA